MNAASAFVEGLGSLSLAADTFNPWRDACPLRDTGSDPAAARRARLARFLEVDDVRLVLIGEAPGHRGARLTGIPFTSEFLLCAGRIPRVGVSPRLSRARTPFREQSATIVWSVLEELGIAERAVTWNCHALHPCSVDNPLINRTPTATEITSSKDVLEAFLALFPNVPVVAIGKTAKSALAALDVDAPYVRHPANGGKPLFTAHLKAVAKEPKICQHGRVWSTTGY